MEWIKIVLALALSAVGGLVFSTADRTIGGAGRRSVAFAAVFGVALAFWGLGLWMFVVLALSWALWRSLPWSIGGTTTPRTFGQKAGVLLRNLMPTAAVLAWAIWQRDPVAFASTPALFVWAVLATDLSVEYAEQIDRYAGMGIEPPWLNERVEVRRGQLFGLAFFGIGALWAVAQALL
jgi:hypothetical protein